MPKNNRKNSFVQEWDLVHQHTPKDVQHLVFQVIDEHAAELSGLFYDAMLADKEAKSFLDHDLVSRRLGLSMQNWMRSLFSLQQQEAAAIYQHQSQIGEMHVRIQIPIALMMRGARLFKQAIAELLVGSRLDRLGLVQATRFVSEVMELGMSAITDSYIMHMGKSVRTDEAFRMFSLGQNMMAERERQRAALLEWSQSMLMYLLSHNDTEAPTMKHSEFGLWLQHKASIIFHDAPELERIRVCVDKLEQGLLPSLSKVRGQQGDPRVVMRQIEEDINEIKFLLIGMFDRFIEVESGRDSLTRLLNRRYLPTILMREVVLSRRSGTPFSLLLLDIDHFKNVNDTHGHDAGDLVLQQVSDVVAANVRVGDFVFRYGGEELLVVLVEISAEQAYGVAESIREKIAQEPVKLGEQADRVTVSIGVAEYDGHPDYERVIKRADDALYTAKQAGRNRCVLADDQ